MAKIELLFLRAALFVAVVVATVSVSMHTATTPEIVYYDDGTVRGVWHRDSQGQLHGQARYYHPSGKLQSLVEFSHDSMLSAKHFDANGRLHTETTEGPNYEPGFKYHSPQ